MLKPEPARAPTTAARTVTQAAYADTQPAPDPALAPTQNGAEVRLATSRDDLALVAIPGAIPPPLQSWDRYEIVRPLGQGGMGSVFLARDRRLGRLVALKFLRVPSPEAAERLLQEARAQARLDHNNICKVFEVGEFLAQPYIAMEFIDGQPLYNAVRRLNLEQKVVLLRQVALAVHVAHSHGILHRDLKPANIMVCAETESAAASGGLRPVLMDFGLARDSLGPQRLTQTGIIMGTPHYMAPEQARGQARHLDRRADVYSLGAMLYELLTGRPPFDSDNEVDLLLSVLNQDPPPPRSIDPSVPSDLEVITLKCLCKEPEQRYESAQALAEDLLRYLHNEPIVARPASTLYRLRRLALRHRARVILAAVILCSLSALLGVTVRANQQQKRAAAESASQRQRSKKQEELAGKLGQVVTEMKLFLRVAYSLPPHDLGREQKIVRLRLGKLEHELTDAEPFLRGTIESALGEGYLAMQEYALAVAHLRHAIDLGQQAPEVHLAMGQALERLYEQKLNELTARQEVKPGNPEGERLLQTYLVPARAELALGSRAELSSPAYITALGHYYNGEAAYPQALASARIAQQEAPWLIEPIEIEAKIVSEQFFNKFKRGDKQSPEEERLVRDTLARAIGIARSYPAFYRYYTSYYFPVVLKSAAWSIKDHNDMEPIFRAAIENAKTAVILEPNSSDSYQQLADAYAHISYLQCGHHDDPRPLMQQGMAAIAAAMKIAPAEARSYAIRSRLREQLVRYLDETGGDPLPDAELAISDMKKATELDPRNPDAWQSSSLIRFRLADFKEERGESGDADVRAAIADAERGLQLRPTNILPRSNLVTYRLKLATDLSEKGKSPAAEFATIHTLLREVEAKNGEYVFLEVDRLEVELAETRELLNQGQNAVAAARQNLAASSALALRKPKNADVKCLQIKAYLLYIQALLAQKQAVGPSIEEALALIAHTPNDVLTVIQRSVLTNQVQVLRVQWLRQLRKSPEPAVRAVLATTAATPMTTGALLMPTLEPRVQVLRSFGEWLLAQGNVPAARAAIQDGLAVYKSALANKRSLSPRLRAEQGMLLALQAQLPGAQAARVEHANQAVAILFQLSWERPPLGRELQPYLQSAEKLTCSAGKTAVTL